MTPMAVAAPILSSPQAAAAFLSRRSNGAASGAFRPRNFYFCVSDRLVCPRERRRSSVCASLLLGGREFLTGRRMSTEGLAKRSRDPQLQDAAPEGEQSKQSATLKKTRNYVAATMSKPGVKSLIVAVAIPLILGTIDGFANSPKIDWYEKLKKPWWQPPSFLFGGTWSILYPLMGLASWLVWAEGGFQTQGKPLGLYAAQLLLNLLWPVLFFGKQRMGLALVDIVALLATLAATIKSFQRVNHVAANLLKPYFGWVTFATILNATLWYLNRNNSEAQAAVQQAHAE